MTIFKIHKSPLFIRIVFVLAVFLMLLVSALTYRHVESIHLSSEAIEHTYKVSIEIEDLYSNIKNLEIERRNFLLTHNEKLPQIILASKAKIFLNLERITKLTEDNKEQAKLSNEIQNLLTQKFKIVDDALVRFDSFSPTELKKNLLEGRIVMEKISIVIQKMLSIERRLLMKRDETSNSLTNSTPQIIFIILFSTIAIITLAFVKINRDLDEMRESKGLLEQTQKIAEDRNRELEASNKELQAFNYVASHDLQEPLRKIQTFISRLIDKDLQSLSSNGQQYLLKIQDSTERMRSLIDDLLQFSRANRSEKVFEKTNFNILLENSKQDLAQVIETKKATIISNNLPETNAIPFQIQQLFTNLINNSLKYSREDVAPIIKIHSSLIENNEDKISKNEKTKHYKITFEDNGIGFDNEYAEKIFVLFNRLHNKEEYSGTGIGLSICKKIVDNHKGYIFAKGDPDKGAIFTIYFPIESENDI